MDALRLAYGPINMYTLSLYLTHHTSYIATSQIQIVTLTNHINLPITRNLQISISTTPHPHNRQYPPNTNHIQHPQPRKAPPIPHPLDKAIHNGSCNCRSDVPEKPAQSHNRRGLGWCALCLEGCARYEDYGCADSGFTVLV